MKKEIKKLFLEFLKDCNCSNSFRLNFKLNRVRNKIDNPPWEKYFQEVKPAFWVSRAFLFSDDQTRKYNIQFWEFINNLWEDVLNEHISQQKSDRESFRKKAI